MIPSPQASGIASSQATSLLFTLFLQSVFLETGFSSDVQVELKEGDSQVSRGQYSLAISHYTNALELDPSSALIYNKRAAAHLSLRQHGSAIRDLDRAIEIDEGYLQGYTLRGRAYLEICKFSKAEADFLKVLSLKPGHKVATRESAKVVDAAEKLQTGTELFEKGDFTGARLQLNQVFDVSRDCLPARMLEAKMSMQEGDFERAIAQTGRLIKSDASNLEALVMRGNAHMHLNDFDMAKKHFGEALRYDSEHKPAKDGFSKVKGMQKKQRAADSALESRDWLEAEALFTEAMGMHPELVGFNHQMKWGLCQAIYNQHKYEDAVAICGEVLEEDDGHEGAADLRIRALMESEEFDQAVSEAREAAERHNNQKFMQLKFEAEKRLKMSKRKDYYKILGVGRLASKQEIKKAYRAAAKIHHPDLATGDKQEAEEKFREIAAAYEILSDEEKRQRYDSGEDLESSGGGGGGGGDFFRSGGQTFTFHFH